MDRNPLTSVGSSGAHLTSERKPTGALKLPKLCRKAWVQLRSNTPSARGMHDYKLCYAELAGLHLVLSQIKGGDNKMVRVVEVTVASFKYFKEEANDKSKRYFIEVTGTKNEVVCFLAKNQGDMTLDSSEQDYINWQRMLAASLNVHVLEQKQYLLKPESLSGNWERLGSGSFGHVFKVKMNGITTVAVKEVLICHAMDSNEIDEKLHVDFINEALISCSLQGPCLINFYGLFWETTDDTVMKYYMVTELCEGGDLRSILYDMQDNGAVEPYPRLPIKTFTRLLSELFSGLAYMHQSSVVHRDIKPDNVMLVRPLDKIDEVSGGIVKIIDYGHSRTLPSKNARLNPGVLTANDRGTELYRAPETVATKKNRSAEYSTKVDIYAAGVICWEMWTRQLPFTEEQKTSRLRVEQMVADGIRPEIPADCPHGYSSLIQWCWEHVPSIRATADQALEQIMDGSLFNEWPLDSPEAILDAVATGYWKRCPGFEAEIATAMTPYTDDTSLQAAAPTASDKPRTNPDAARFRVFMEQIRDAIQTKASTVALPLEAIRLVLLLAPDADQAAGVFAGLRDAVPIMVSLLLSDLLMTPREVDNCMELVCLLSKWNSESSQWCQLTVPLLNRFKKDDTSVRVLTLATRFFTHTMSRDVAHHNAEDADVAAALIDVTVRHCDEHALVAGLATFLEGMSRSTAIMLIARLHIADLLKLAHRYIDDSTLLKTWLDLFGAMSNNALGSFEIVEAGIMKLLQEAIAAHPDHSAVALSFTRVLAAITAEPAHVVTVLEHPGISRAIFRLCERFENDNDSIVLYGVKTLANCCNTPSLQHRLLDDGAADLFYRVLQATRLQQGYLQAEAFRMANGLAQDASLLREVLPEKTCDSFVPTIEAILALGLSAPITPGLELLCKLLLSEDHLALMRDLQGPRVLTNALTASGSTSANSFALPPVTVETLKQLCMDPRTSDQIVDAQGPKKVVGAMRTEAEPEHLTALVLCVAGMARHTPRGAKQLIRQGAVEVLSNILLQKAVHVELLTATMKALRCIAEKYNCRKQFEMLQLKRTIDSVVPLFEDHAELVDNANAALVAALPETAYEVAPHVGSVSGTNTPMIGGEIAHSEFKVILIGDSNVGKSCIAMRACQQIFSPNIKTTLGVNIDFAELKFPLQKVTLQIYDTAGQEQYRSMTRQFYRGCNAALLVYDLTSMESFENLARWHAELKAATDSVSVVAVVGAKSDLASEAVVPNRMAEKFAKKIGGHHTVVSAVANTGIHQLFRKVSEELMTQYPDGLNGRRMSGFTVGASSGSKANCCS
eukprot:m.18755 g.18755  ORF g.18755 m.18755 type:complete len:1300 (-) comp3624_c0_seq2:178-4077(-)